MPLSSQGQPSCLAAVQHRYGTYQAAIDLGLFALTSQAAENPPQAVAIPHVSKNRMATASPS